jgi:ABC-2 type transport system ATP-binding protein
MCTLRINREGKALATLIEAQNLRKSFGPLVAVNGVSLKVEAGEIYGLVGPDGAGKTTTIRLLCGALSLEEGKAAVAGFDITHHPEQARAHIGYLSQRFSMYEELTVIENLRFFAEVRGVSRKTWWDRCMDILTFVGLDEFTERRAGHLSGGMKQKLGLAAALVHSPKVLLLDEPTTGVDPVTRQDFWQLIIRLAEEEGVAILVSTPYMDEATRCHRVGFMRQGQLLKEGTPASLRALLQDRIVELAGEPLKLLRHLAGQDEAVEAVQMFGDRLHLRVRAGSTAELVARLREHIPAQGAEISRLRVIPPLLEDVFISLSEG